MSVDDAVRFRGDYDACGAKGQSVLPDRARQEGLREQIAATMEDAKRPARQAPAVRQAIAAWKACLKAAVGTDADSPNDLARRYAFKGTAPTAAERDIAAADAACQEQTGLRLVYDTAVADATRSDLGTNVSTYDDLARSRVALTIQARSYLAQNGIPIVAVVK